MRCKSMRRLIGSMYALSLLLCASLASAVDVPAAPDYAQPAAWAAYPGRSSRVDEVPAGVAHGSDMGTDVFFIHPTTYLAPVMGNAPFDAEGEVGARVDEAILRFQASVFNGCCRIFALRYRQASLRAITTNSVEAYAIDDLAYGDVARAFEIFLKQIGSRPFIIASHSQGSIHALRLLQQQVMGTPLQKRLVAAYIIGTALPVEIEQRGLPVCRSATQTNCVITWNSVRSGHDDRRRHEDAVIWWDGRYQAIAGRALVCVNPLNWQPDAGAAEQANLGGVYSDGRNATIPAPVVGLTGAVCENGLLGVDIPREQRRHFGDVLTLMGIYHDFDYGLFYMNLRSNAVERVRAFRP